MKHSAIVYLGALLILAACSFQRDNPQDAKNPDYIQLSIALADGILCQADSLDLPYEVKGAADSLRVRFLEGPSRDTTSWEYWSLDSLHSLLRGLDEGSYALELAVVRNQKVIASDTFHFTVDAVQGPALVLTPKLIPDSAVGSIISWQVQLESVTSVLGWHGVLQWDTSAYAFHALRSPWTIFADSLATGLEISAVTLDSTYYSGSGTVATLELLVKSRKTWTSITWIPSTTELQDSNGVSLPWHQLRGSASL